jgi:4-aminobutyrate aminotransferase-like enzyme
VTKTIAHSVESGDFFSTYGGNPVCCAVALESINIIEEDNLIQNSVNMGKFFIDELERLQNRFEIIGDIRGKGLMIGIELVKDRNTKTPDVDATKKIVNDMQNNGVLMGLGGFYGNVLRLQPPLVITEDQSHKVMTKMTQALERL